MSEEDVRPWGRYDIISKTKIIKVKPEQKLSLQFHHLREEFWQILKGTGKVEINGEAFGAREGDTFVIPKRATHRITVGPDSVEFLEVAT